MQVVSLKGVSKAYNGVVVVRDLSLEIASGEIVALLGQTGAGKSAILNMIMGQTAPSTGEVRINGFDPRSNGQDLRGFMAVSFQTDRLLPWRTAEQNVALGLEALHVSPPEIRRRALAAIDLIGLDGFELFGAEHIERARHFGLDRCATWPVGDQPHLANRRVPAQASYAHRPAFTDVDNDADTAFENEMHRSCGFALPGNDITSLNFEPPANFGQPVGIVGVAERLGKPCAQRRLIGRFADMFLDDRLLACFQRMIEIRRDGFGVSANGT